MNCCRTCVGLVLITSTIALSACKDPPTGPPKELTALPRSLTAAEQKVATSGNAFTFALFKQVNGAQRDSNVFISPLSASMALGMTMNGAVGSTFSEMRTTLGFDAAELADINQGYKGLISLLRGLDETSEFKIANSVWSRQDFPVDPTFVATTQNFFDAKVASLNFSDPATLTTINNWVSTSTNGKIPRILNVIRPNDVMFLVNAIYFKAKWRTSFDKSKTLDAPFNLANGTTQSVRMMNQKATIAYRHTPTLAVADLLYGNGAFAMTIVLPDRGEDINAIAETLTPESWNSLTEEAPEAELYISLPKFKLEYERTLNDDLKALGMPTAFDANAADFSKLGEGGAGLFISFVKQKTYVDVYEEGTEAAAATVVAIGRTSGPPSFIVDRPFIFAIRERITGTILFIGKVMSIPPA